MRTNPVPLTTLLTALLITLAAAPPVLSDTIYRWNDERGNPVISDRPPPPGTPYTTVNPDFGGKRKAANAPAQPAFGRPGPPIEATDPEATAARDPEKIPELCERARENIYKLETFARIRTYDANGEARYITDDERASQLENAKAIEANHCDD